MEPKKLLVTIVVAVYEPNMQWLKEQLSALNKQSYPNLELLVCDDCSQTVSFEEIKDCVQENITRFGVQVERNEKNLGSNRTFERLTLEAKGQYIAYCDQDDIWMPQKISVLVQAIQNGTIAYSDMSVINGEGKLIAEHLKEIRPRIHYVKGKSLETIYAFANCTAGCSMLICSRAAKAAIPFPEQTVCDQWLCMVAAHFGEVVFVPEVLMKYRQHGNNQTGILADIYTKEDYLQKRILPVVQRVREFDCRFGATRDMIEFARARENQIVAKIWKYRALCRKDAYFDIMMKYIPEWVAVKIISCIRGS